MSLRVVVAPDAFKGTIRADEAAAAIADGWLSVRSDDEVVLCPQADGGEGTLDAMRSAIPDAVVRSAGPVTGPDGRPVEGAWLELPDGTAVVELARSSGLPLMPHLAPMTATTRGLGEVIAAALTHGASALVIALGGSASTDGGLGALQALGLDARDAGGRIVGPGAAGLAAVATLDASHLRMPPAGGVRLLTDVRSPLLGPRGASAVFGPQKGATPAQVQELELILRRWSQLAGGDPTVVGGGAAGGTAYGLAVLWGARIQPGAETIAHLTGLADAARDADVLVTGEGRFDASSLEGKVVGHALGLPGERTRSIVIAGEAAHAAPAGAALLALTEFAGSAASAQREPGRWLRVAGAAAARGVER